MRRWNLILAIAAALTCAPATSQAQNFGAQLDWGSDTDIGVGVRAEFPLTNTFTNTGALSRAFLITSFDWFVDPCDAFDCTIWELNGNLAVPISAQTLRPYVGGGLNLSHFSVDGGGSDSNVGINLLGGLKFPVSTMTGYAEARAVVGDADQIVLTFGLLFGKSK